MKKTFLSGKKAIALLSALGVTATLLSPMAQNNIVLANDETIQDTSSTIKEPEVNTTEQSVDEPMTVSSTSYYGQYYNDRYHYLDVSLMNSDKSILLNELNTIYNKFESIAENEESLARYLYVCVPEGFSLDPNNQTDAELIKTFKKLSSVNFLEAFYVKSEESTEYAENLLYSIPMNSIDFDSIKTAISFPKVESLMVTNTYIKDIVTSDSENYLFSIDLLSNYLPANELYIHPTAFFGYSAEKTVYYLPNYDITKIKRSFDYWNPPTYFYSINMITYTLDEMNCLYLKKNSDKSIGFIASEAIPLYNYGPFRTSIYTLDTEYENHKLNDVTSLESELRVLRKSYGPNFSITYAFEKGEEKLIVNKDILKTLKEYNTMVNTDKYGVPFSVIEYDDIINGGEVNYRLTFETIDNPLDFNPNLTYNVKDNNGIPQFQFDFEHSGALPGTMTVSAYVGTEYNKETVYLYYINENNKLEKQEVEATIEGGYINFQIDHCSSYLVSMEEVDENNNLIVKSESENESMDSSENNTTSGNTSENTNTTTEDNQTVVDTDSTNNTTTNVENTTTENSSTDTTKEDTKHYLTNTDSPSTGDTTKIALYFASLLIAGIALIASFKFSKKSN